MEKIATYRVFHLDQCQSKDLEERRGRIVPMVNAALGTGSLDVHLNILDPGEARGRLHRHTNSDNVYIVKSGTAELVVEDEQCMIGENDVVFIPAGLRHSLSNTGNRAFEVFEIYAPAGDRFDFISEK